MEWAEYIDSGKIRIPNQVENGLNLIWNSDLVISGGGTMNREAAAMGVPVYSIFRGKIGAVDHFLASEGRLVLLESVSDVTTKIQAIRREKQMPPPDRSDSPALKGIIESIVSIVQTNPGHRKL